ncbi:MAG TPA: rRNA pseudouridine synthase [Clostridiaceae bacterium]|nr:rRNA pseudouridine synthase [Clostridiaceae bacterium]
MAKVRLQKYIAQSGIASRRKAEDLIKSGMVKVNGKVVLEPWVMVDDSDDVRVNDKPIFREKRLVYIMLNKPVGYITTAKEQFSRKTVLDLIKGIPERIFPVGRLDYDTSGLLLLTNDGQFAYKLTHPKYEIKKVYIAKVKGIPSEDEIKIFETGLEIDDYITAPAKLKIRKILGNKSILEIVIHEGRNRQIRKMCEAIGHPVIELCRISIGNVSLGSLPVGKWRYLTKKEVQSLMNLKEES